MKKLKFKSGTILIQAFVFGVISVVMIGALVSWAGANIKGSRIAVYREQALQIAEAGIDYYRWHLAHNQSDYQDGNATSSAMYTHDFVDKDGTKIGTFILTITPPPSGSTIVTIVSKGTVINDPSIKRTIKVIMGIPSIAKYAMVTNSFIYYSSGDEVYGPIHSNVGVGFLNGSPQPIAHNVVTSAGLKFSDGTGTHFGVYTTVPSSDPNPPNPVPNRPDVFQSGRQFPVAAVDFVGITTDLSSIKTKAQAGGYYRAGSGVNGYKVVLKTNDTFDLYKVNSLLPIPKGCADPQSQPGWGVWSVGIVGSATTLLGNYSFPANNLMFFEDNVWVEGQINGARLTIAVGSFPINPLTYKNIIVNNNLTYTNFDGQDAIGLIAQNNFLVGMASADNLTIDAAIVAQNGATIRYYYPNPKCSPWDSRNTLKTYGMFASNGQGYFYYGGTGNGYAHQPASYDANLLYAPPPSFPLTSNQYQIISWKEI